MSNVTLLILANNFNGNIDYSISGGSGGKSTGDRMELKRGNEVTFTHANNSAGGILEITNLSSFSDNSPIYLGVGASQKRTISASASIGALINIFIDRSGSGTDYFYAEVISNVVTAPSQFELTSVITAQRSTYYDLSEFVVQGINSPSPVTTTNCQYSVNGSSTYLTSSGNRFVNNGDIIRVRGYSGSNYDQTTSHTLDIGGVSDTGLIRTQVSPQDGAIIPFPHGSPISLRQVTEFYGAPIGGFNTQAPRTMSAYRKGGLYVPNITQNSGVASTDQAEDLKLSSFGSSATSFYFKVAPRAKFDSKSVNNTSALIVLHWAANTDWTLGYGALQALNTQYRYELIEDPATAIKSTGVTFFTETGSPGTYSTNNDTFTIQKNQSANMETMYTGTVKIFMRPLINPNIVVTQEVYYRLNFYY